MSYVTSPQKPYQVIILGHNLSKASLRYLRSLGPYKPYKFAFRIDRFDEPFQPIWEMLKHLILEGCDLSGRTPTIWQTTGSSVGAHALHCAIHSVTGQHPRILNLIRRGADDYVPSPERPVVDFNEFFNAFPEAYAALTIQTQEQAEKEALEAAEDGFVDANVIDMGVMRNSFRNLRTYDFLNHTDKMAAAAAARATEKVVVIR